MVELQSLSLRARGWPIGEARVDIHLEPVGAETQVTISEDAVVRSRDAGAAAGAGTDAEVAQHRDPAPARLHR